MNDNKKPVEYGPSTYDFNFDFDFQLKFNFWDYCQLAAYMIFYFPLYLFWQVALSPAATRLRNFALRKSGMESQGNQVAVGAACPWPPQAGL